MPGKQFSDDLSSSDLVVGEVYSYCTRAVGPGNSGERYSSVETCVDHKVAWEASIDGIVTLDPSAGSLPVTDVTVTWQLFGRGKTLIDEGSEKTDRSGKYYIVFNKHHDQLDSKSDFEVRLVTPETNPALCNVNTRTQTNHVFDIHRSVCSFRKRLLPKVL